MAFNPERIVAFTDGMVAEPPPKVPVPFQWFLLSNQDEAPAAWGEVVPYHVWC
jgi:hypothetical protein